MEASLLSMSGASPVSISVSWVSFFAILSSRLLIAGQVSQSFIHRLTRRVKPLLFFEGQIVARHQTPRGLDERRLNLACRRQRLDREAEVAPGNLWITIAAGEGKADIAAFRHVAPGDRRV